MSYVGKVGGRIVIGPDTYRTVVDEARPYAQRHTETVTIEHVDGQGKPVFVFPDGHMRWGN